MDSKLLQQQLAVMDGRVAVKANELLRLAAVKIPQGTLRQVDCAHCILHASLAATQFLRVKGIDM
jgi:hypothetical protein